MRVLDNFNRLMFAVVRETQVKIAVVEIDTLNLATKQGL